MLSFFPDSYPDELLYSILARYHARSGNTSPKASLRDLFGRTTASAIVDLPCNVDALTKNMPSIWRYGADTLIQNHTLFPLYAPFLPAKRADSIYRSMKGDNGGDIYTQAGIMASSIRENRFFKFCPICSAEDERNYGELYWHRLHQIPGVLVCPRHEQSLLNSSIPIHGQNKHEYWAALKENCPVTPIEISFSNKIFDQLIKFAFETDWVLKNSIASPENLDWYRDIYIVHLINKGLATCKGRIYTRELMDAFIDFHGNEFLCIVQSSIDINQENNWLLSIVRKHRKGFHPIRHLLMMEFLVGSAKLFFDTPIDYKPFGDSPWPCLNGAASHYRQSVVTKLNVTYCADTKRPVGTFVCDCGFIYSRRGPDQAEKDRYKIGRVKDFGIVWEEKLRELLSLKDISFREIARRLRVDTNTVIKYSKIIESKQKGSSLKDFSQSATLQDEYRGKWLQLQKDNPYFTKSALRQANQAAYIWLYRNDKDWLSENSPTKSQTYVNPRVDWESRDKEVLQLVRQAVYNEMLSAKPSRITLGRIGRKINLLALLEKHLDKMPKTKAYLETVCETVEVYQLRRITGVARTLRAEGDSPKVWKIIRIAGIRPGYGSIVAKALEAEESVCFDLNYREKSNLVPYYS